MYIVWSLDKRMTDCPDMSDRLGANEVMEKLYLRIGLGKTVLASLHPFWIWLMVDSKDVNSVLGPRIFNNINPVCHKCLVEVLERESC